MHKTFRIPAGLCARLRFSFTGAPVAPRLEGAVFGQNRQAVNFQPDGQDALLLPTMPHGVWPYEVRADGKPILHGHIEVFPSPLAESHGTMEWQVDCDLAATVAAVAVTLTQGPKGEKGDPGPQGPQGEPGPQGPPGSDAPGHWTLTQDSVQTTLESLNAAIVFSDFDGTATLKLANTRWLGHLVISAHGDIVRDKAGTISYFSLPGKSGTFVVADGDEFIYVNALLTGEYSTHKNDESSHLKPGVSTYLDTLVQRAILPPAEGTLATLEAVAPDPAFNPASAKAQSGTAVLQAIQKVDTRVADYGLVTETLDLTGYTIDTTTRTAATDELWLEFGGSVPPILWPSTWIWLEGEAPYFSPNTAYCICVRAERHGLLIANLAYEFTPPALQTNAD